MSVQVAPQPAPPTASAVDTIEKYFAGSTVPEQHLPSLMQLVSIDINNSTANTSSSDVRKAVVGASSHQLPLALGLLINREVKLFFLPFRIEQVAGAAPDPSIDNRIFAVEGDLINGEASLVHLVDSHFNQLTHLVQVPTVAHIQTQIASNNNPDFMMGPYDAADASTEAVKTRQVCIIPSKYVPYFGQKITPRAYFGEIYPIIEANGEVDDMKPLTKYFQIAITRQTANVETSLLQVYQPSCPPRNVALLERKQSLLKLFLTGLNHQPVNAAGEAVAASVASIREVMLAQSHKEEERKSKKKESVVEEYMAHRFTTLLKLCCVTHESQLPKIWKQLAEAKDKNKLGVLEGAIQQELRDMGQARMANKFVLTSNFLNDILSLYWAMPTSDSLDTGSMANPFLLSDTNVEHQQMLNKWLHMIQSGGAAPDLAAVKQLTQMKLNLPGEDDSLRYILRLVAVQRVCLPLGHPATTWLYKHHCEMKEFEQEWKNQRGHLGLKGVLHLIWVGNRLSQYFRNQAVSSRPLAVHSNPSEIVEKIERQEDWEPRISPTCIDRFNLGVMMNLGQQAACRDDATAATEMSSLSGASSQGTGGTPGGVSTGGGSNQNERVDNTAFNTSLFLSYKESAVKCKELRKKIKEEKLEKLPDSKLGIPDLKMCLAWHTKGMCNTGCPMKADHVAYTADELAPMVTWCANNYHKDV